MILDWKATLATVAPALASALAGPLAGTAMGAVASALGFSKGLSEQKLIEEAVLQASPDVLAQLRAADADFQLAMAELKIDLEALANEDRSDARQRQTDLKDQTPAHLAWAVFAALFAVIGVLSFVEIPVGSKETFVLLAGSLSTIAGMASTYYWGSSTGSELKTKLLARKTD